MADVINSVSVAMKAFMVKINPPEEIMEKMVSIAKVAKERGLMALENEAPDDAFAAKAFQFLADGFDENQIKELLKKDINLTVQRHTTGQKVSSDWFKCWPIWPIPRTSVRRWRWPF